MTLLILQCISEMSFSIKSEYLKFSVFNMRISEDDEKWVWNIIFILSYAVIAMSKHSDLIREKTVVWVSMSATAFLAHFAVLNSLLKNCLTFCMIFQYSLRFCFLMILLFLSYAWMYFVQSLIIWQLFLIHCMLLMIFIHFFVHSALIISCDLAQRVEILMIFFSTFSSCLVYSFMRWCLISWFNSDFNIYSFKILINFSSFIVFQLWCDFCVDFLQTLKSILVCIYRWSEKFFISSLILHRINWFIMSSVVKIRSIIIWDLW